MLLLTLGLVQRVQILDTLKFPVGIMTHQDIDKAYYTYIRDAMKAQRTERYHG
jgi:hypothetical protein